MLVFVWNKCVVERFKFCFVWIWQFDRHFEYLSFWKLKWWMVNDTNNINCWHCGILQIKTYIILTIIHFEMLNINTNITRWGIINFEMLDVLCVCFVFVFVWNPHTTLCVLFDIWHVMFLVCFCLECCCVSVIWKYYHVDIEKVWNNTTTHKSRETQY